MLPRDPLQDLGATHRGRSPARVASAGPSEEHGRSGYLCELTLASPFVQACPGREVPTLGQLCPSLWGLSPSPPQPGLWSLQQLAPGALQRTPGLVQACISCRPHGMLRMGKQLCSGFISLANFFWSSYRNTTDFCKLTLYPVT